MSVRFQDGAKLRAIYRPPTTPVRLDGLPVSVQAWIYFEDGQPPQGTDVWPLWALGQENAANAVALEARKDPGDPDLVELTAVFTSGARVTVSRGGLETGAWHLASVVLEPALQGNAKLSLYVDDLAVVTTTQAQGGLTPAYWDVFLLAGTLDGTLTVADPKFRVEHPAIWSTALAAGQATTSDAGKMYTEKIPPWQADTRLTSGTGKPDFGYWFITAHSRSGLRVLNTQVTEQSGDLYNEALPDDGGEPFLQLVQNGTPPRWSAATPILRYVYNQPIEPSPRPPFPTPSRLRPVFFVVNHDASDGTNEKIRALPIYSDADLSKVCGGDYTSADELAPRYRGATTPYLPTRDIALIAKRCADYFEMQSMTVGNGTGPGKRYAGAIQIRGTGNGGLLGKGPTLVGYDGGDFRGFRTEADGIPLELNIADWVDPGSEPNDYVLRPWQTWYRATGVELLAEYMDHFWRALKQELDERGLCYPLRLHMDYERWPDAPSQLRLDTIDFNGQSFEIQTGTWPKILADTDRYENEEIAFVYDSSGAEVAKTLEDLSPESYDAGKKFYDQSEAFARWWWSWSYVTRMQAAADSIFKTVNTYFEHTRWGNYDCFAADNPDYPFVEGWEGTDGFFHGFNSAADGVVRGDFSTPVLYTNPGWIDRVRGEYGGRVGYTVCEALRDLAKMRIEACANSRRKLPLAPTFENPGRRLEYGADGRKVEYFITEEDLREVMAHAWQRGADEYLMFSFQTTLATLESTVNVCQWLRDTVHSAAQYHQDHAARTGRLSRRAM